MLEAIINNNQKVVIANENGQWHLNDQPITLDIQPQPNGLWSILYNGKSFTGILENIDKKNKEISLRINGNLYQVAIKEPIDQLLSKMGLDLKASQKIEPIKAPMPGLILKIMVEPGQSIKKGDGLIVLEAMKMENILKAAADATVKSIKVTEKTAVEKGAILIELE